MTDNKNAYRLDISDLPQNCVSIKSPIVLTKNQFELIQKICEITDERLETYIKDALLQKVQTDLENPSCFGQSVCETLSKKWNSK